MSADRTLAALGALLGFAIACASCSNTPTPYPSVSGEALPVGDLPGWRQIFVDDFAGDIALGAWTGCAVSPFDCAGLPEAYRGRWWAFPEAAGWTDHGHGAYSPARTLSVHDGVLDIFLNTENGTHWVAAPVPFVNGQDAALGQLYGRYAIRFRTDALRGYKIAFLLWPDSETWPRDGEIDFPEAELDGPICAFTHYQNGTAANDADDFYSGVAVAGAWHTAVIEWERDSVRYLLDGSVLGVTTERVPNTPMHWVFEATTSLNGIEPRDDVSGHVQIDWVAVYAING